jgi:hypothetical protein
MPLTDDYRRLIVGVLTVVVGFIALWLNVVDPALGDEYPQFAAGAIRMAPVLAVVWLALPEVRRGPGAILFMVGVVCAVAIAFKSGRTGLKFLVPALGVLMALAWFRRITAVLSGASTRRK